MATPSATEVSQKWVRNIGQSTEAIRQGVQRVNTSPTAAAAAASDVWQQRVSDARTKEKFRNSLNRVSLDQWKQATLNKGIPRIASGAQAAASKMEAFLSEFLPFQATITERVRQMPKVTLEDGIARAAAQIRGTAEFRRTR